MDVTTAGYVRRGVALLAAAVVHAGNASNSRRDGATPGDVVNTAADFMKFMEGRTR